jgi:hypothetical protein
MAAAHKALITDKIENSTWLKDNVKLPPAFLRPALERQMKIVFDGDGFNVINVDSQGGRMLSYELAGLYPNSEETIKRIVTAMPGHEDFMNDNTTATADSHYNHSAHAQNIKTEPVHSSQITRADFDARTPTEKMDYVRSGGTII